MPAPPAILVTGASSGIGRAAVRVALANGALVYASVRRQADAEALAGELGERVQPILFDVTDEAAVSAAAAEIAARQRGRRLLGVVNNAGICLPGALLHLTAAELRGQLEANVVGQHCVTRAFAPLLGAEGPSHAAEGKPGRFVMVSSVSGRQAMPFIGAYVASKHALEGYAGSLRRELLPFGVDVIVVAPGPVKTEIWAKARAGDRAHYIGTRYARPLAAMEGEVARMEADGVAPEAVAELIWRVLTKARPKTRYEIHGQPLAAILPPRLVDRLVGQRLGLAP